MEKRNQALRDQEETRRRLIQEKKTRQEQILREAQEKKDKKIKKRMLEDRWEMAKWITKYIDENQDRWAEEKKEREKSNKNWMEDWARLARFEKIRNIRERKEKEMRPKLTVTLQKEKLITKT